MSGNTMYKSDAFAMLLEDKENALEVYNALNHSNYQNPDEVEIITLEKGVSLSIRNDAAFIVGMYANFYEHQSTYNPNMPLRNLIYYANTIEEWIKKNDLDLFGSSLIKITTPHFVVFYNGLQKRPETERMQLSDAFQKTVDSPALELICTSYNINKGMNEEIKLKSKVISGYCFFVDTVREKQREFGSLEDAIDFAIAKCIEQGILVDFFTQRGDEVRKMTHLDFTFEHREHMIRRDAKQEGIEEGIKEGIKEGKQEAFLSSLMVLLEGKGVVSDTILKRLQSLDEDQLKELLVVAANVTTVEEFAVMVEKIN